MFADNIENIDMIRTPLKTRNQEFTPALGKRQAARTMFATPTKRMMTATPRSVLGNKNVQMTPCAFLKPKMTPTMKFPLKTPGRGLFTNLKNEATPSKFSIYEDKDEDIIKEMKRKHFTIEQPERCPWADTKKCDEKALPEPPVLEIVDDFCYEEPNRKKIRPISIEPLPVQVDDCLLFQLSTDYTLPDLTVPPGDEEVELCPWTLTSTERQDISTAEVELELSTFSDLDVTKENLSEISIRCFNDSYRILSEALSDDELPDIPSTPDLDRQLGELLEMSFDNLIL